MEKLDLMANKLRVLSILSTTKAGSGHPTTCMSCAEIMSTLFFHEIKKEDEFVLSKGHAAPILWSCYKEAGIITDKQLMSLRQINSNIEGHPMPPLVKIATGSLGQGLSAGVGIALAQNLKKKGRTYVLLGDSECAEGSVWEACNAAAHFKLKNIVAILDCNRLGQRGETMHGHNTKIYANKFKAFGWDTLIVDGHNTDELLKALKLAKKSKKPFAIIAKTLKGKGFSEVENKNGWHGKVFSKEQAERALWEIPYKNIKLKSNYKIKKTKYNHTDFKLNKYKLGEKVATRDAFGKALEKAGKNKSVVAIDSEVGNSTKLDYFFKKYPKRSFENYIAEQNMVGMALGFSTQNYIPVISTFATFFTRAYDFIRMAMYSQANIKLIGSHAGVSIGADGPSQMGLEDLSMMLPLPGTIILYPSDAVSTENLLKNMIKHNGLSYMRTTRGKTPVIYKNSEKFPIGKFKVVKKSNKDIALVIGAGETLHEALKAYDLLKHRKKNIRVIDLYSIKPVDAEGLRKHAKQCKNNVIVVEDHYECGIGEVVSKAVGRIKHLYVKGIPKSGTPEQLRRKFNIDAQAIIKEI